MTYLQADFTSKMLHAVHILTARGDQDVEVRCRRPTQEAAWAGAKDTSLGSTHILSGPAAFQLCGSRQVTHML